MLRKNINVSSLIALCYINNDYSNFIEGLFHLMPTKYNRNFVINLNKISNGTRCIGLLKIKDFYQSNKSVIDKINRYSNIATFIGSFYDVEGNLEKESNLDFFNNYIKIHQNDLDKIISVLCKIKSLGFDTLQFNEKADFCTDNYYVKADIDDNDLFSFVDNIEVVSSCQDDLITFVTKGSDYKIDIEVLLDRLLGCRIEVNNLLFDPERLPEKISKKYVFDNILELNDNKQIGYDSIKDVVNLSVTVNDLCSQFNITNRVISDLNTVSNKEQLLDILNKTQKYLEQLKRVSSRCVDRISKDNSNNANILRKKYKID